MHRFVLTSLCAATALVGFSSAASAREMVDYSIAKLRALDKITARTVTFQADVGSTIKFGSLYIKVQACRKAPPVETPESAAFLQIWEEHQAKEKSSIGIFNTTQEWVFSGWMFASSPALSYVDHPIYDVWAIDCLKDVTDDIDDIDQDELMEGEGTVLDNTTPDEPDTENLPEPTDQDGLTDIEQPVSSSQNTPAFLRNFLSAGSSDENDTDDMQEEEIIPLDEPIPLEE